MPARPHSHVTRTRRPSRPSAHASSSHVERLEDRRMLAADPLSVLIGGAAAKSVQFVDANGTRAIIRVVGQGNAAVNFSGTSLSQGGGARGIVVSGSGISVDSIALSRTGLATTLLVTTVGRTPVTVGGITSDGTINSILAPGVALAGNLTTTGWAHQIDLNAATGGTINIGPSHSNGGLILTLGSATDENLVSAVRVDNLNAGQWASSSRAGGDSIQAPQILGVHVHGTFDANLTVPGIAGARVSLQTFVAGAITAGTWAVTGNAHLLQAGSVAPGWSASVSGKLDNLNVAHDATIDLTAPQIGSLAVHGALSDSTVTVTQPLTPVGFDLNSLFVGGAMVNSTVNSAGSINVVSVGRMQDSSVFAGLVSPALPTTTVDFANTAQIKSVTLRRSPASASFTGSNIAAYDLGSLTLGTVATANGGTPFGFAAHSIRSVALTDQTTNHSVRLINLSTTTAFNAALAAKGIAQGDLVGEIV